MPLIGRLWMDILMPGWRKVYEVGEASSSFNVVSLIKSKCPSVLSDQPNQTIKNFTAEIVMSDNAVPIFHKAYTVPFKIREKVNNELDRLCAEGIRVPVEFSDWASPVVIVNKASGGIRLCIDCKVTINKYVKMQHYPLSRIDDIFACLANSSYFCVLDLTGAYTQLKVSEHSRQYLTINTHKGLFQYTTLCFRVATAPSIFQSVMDQILLGVEGVACYLDDILIGGGSTLKNVQRC